MTRMRAAAGSSDVAVVEDDEEKTTSARGETTSPEDQSAPRDVDEEHNQRRGLLGWLDRRREQRRLEGDFASYPHLLAVKPKERYLFRSDYFEVDQSVACVLSYVHDDASHDRFGPFWGIDRIPDGLDDRVTAVVLEQIKRETEGWVDAHTRTSERLDTMEGAEQSESGTSSTKRKAAKASDDLDLTNAEIQDGASYLSVHNRLLLKAPDLGTLEESIERITRLYIDRFGTLKTAPYAGEQRQELTNLFRPNKKKRGKGFHFTSTELAGSYSLVTNGLNDRGGEYVGYMVGDVNNSGMLMDVNAYDRHVVVADSSISTIMERQRVSSMWCSKIAQAALLNNGRVVHLVLDGTDLDQVGPSFSRLTSRVDLNSGDVNMFEMWGDVDEVWDEENQVWGKADDEMAIFSSQMEKLKLMFEQLYDSSDGAMASIIRSELEAVATDFYIDRRMWHANAKNQRHRLSVVGLPHDQVPRLQMFVAYLDSAHEMIVNSEKNDPKKLEAMSVLQGIAHNLLSTNGDLFNNHTVDAIDGVRDSRRVVYDFSRLMRRGVGVAMAQLVNIVGFAVGTLGEGDTVIVHGTEHVDDRVKDYIAAQFDALHERGGRVVYSYNNVDKMLADVDFNAFDAADYTIFGWMREKTVLEYQKKMAQQIPPDLQHLITRKNQNLTYLRRGVTNVVFHLDLLLGNNPAREAQRRAIDAQAVQEAKDKRLAVVTGDEEPTPGANTTGGAARARDFTGEDEEETAEGHAPSKPARRRSLRPSSTGDVGTESISPEPSPSSTAPAPRTLARR